MSALLSRHTDETIAIEGSAQRHTRIVEVPTPPFVQVCGVGCQLAVVARCRLSLFNTAMLGLCSGAVERVQFGVGVNDAYSMFGGCDKLMDVYALSLGRAHHDMLCPNCGAAQFAEVGYARFRAIAHERAWQERPSKHVQWWRHLV